MTDSQLIQLFGPIIENGLIARNITGVELSSSYEPTQEGANTAPTIYFFKLFDRRYGFLSRQDYWDDNDDEEKHREIQVYETTFQVNAIVKQSPDFPDRLTSSDLINEVSCIMQSDSALQTLLQSSVQILRIQDIRNTNFLDDRNQYEASASFDFTLIHKRDIITEQSVVQSINPGIYPI